MADVLLLLDWSLLLSVVVLLLLHMLLWSPLESLIDRRLLLLLLEGLSLLLELAALRTRTTVILWRAAAAFVAARWRSVLGWPWVILLGLGRLLRLGASHLLQLGELVAILEEGIEVGDDKVLLRQLRAVLIIVGHHHFAQGV